MPEACRKVGYLLDKTLKTSFNLSSSALRKLLSTCPLRSSWSSTSRPESARPI